MAIHVVELQQLREDVPHGVRSRIGPHDRDLGERVGQDGLGYGPPLGRVAVEQAVGLVAANDGGKLPAEVGRVDQPKAQPLAAHRRMDVRRITGEQDAILAVRVDQARGVRPAVRLLDRRHADIRAADPSQHAFDLLARDGRLAIGRRTAEVVQPDPARPRSVDEDALRRAGHLARQALGVVEVEHGLVHGQARRRAGKGETGQLADGAAPAVTADQPGAARMVRPGRGGPADLDAIFMLLDARDLAPAP